jgi:hypothetical protein
VRRVDDIIERRKTNKTPPKEPEKKEGEEKKKDAEGDYETWGDEKLIEEQVRLGNVATTYMMVSE